MGVPQMSSPLFNCPRCLKETDGFPALSRKDNKTNICSACGVLEAYEDAGISPPFSGGRYWAETTPEPEPSSTDDA